MAKYVYNRQALSGQTFGFQDAAGFLRSVSRAQLNDLVARSAFYYDKQIRSECGIRYLPLHSSAVRGFESRLTPGFCPDLKTYASVCSTSEAAFGLGYVCSKVHHFVNNTMPPFMRDDSLEKQSDLFVKSEIVCARDAWKKTCDSVMQSALIDAYVSLVKNDRELCGEFVRNLDPDTRSFLRDAVMNCEGLDETFRNNSDKLFAEYPVKSEPFKSYDFDPAEQGFYSWSFCDPVAYDNYKDTLDYARRYSKVDCGISSNGHARSERHQAFDDRVFCRIGLRKSLLEGQGVLSQDIYAGLDLHYKRMAGAFIRNGSFKSPRVESGVTRIDIEDLFRSCPDCMPNNIHERMACVSAAAKACTYVYNNAAYYLDFNKNHITARRWPGLIEQMQSNIVSNTLAAYENFYNNDGEDIAGSFVRCLSDELRSAICARDESIGKKFGQTLEVMDADGLSANCELLDSRTKRALDKRAYRAMLDYCMYRYEFNALTKDNEMNAFILDDFSGKVPNESFLHIAANCKTPQDARMLARVVNLCVQARSEDSDMTLDFSVRSLMQDDLKTLLSDSTAFSSDALQEAFAEGLSESVLSRLRVRDFADESLSQSLAKCPVESSDDDLIYAKDCGALSRPWFRKSSVNEIVHKAVSTASHLEYQSQDDAAFPDVAVLATACCSDYANVASGEPVAGQVGLNDVLRGCGNTDDLRKAAKVCNLAFDSVSDGQSCLLFTGLSDDSILAMKAKMSQDMLDGYNSLGDAYKPKFVSGLSGFSRDVLLQAVGGAWSNGVFLDGVDASKAPAAGYANRLNMFCAPDFSQDKFFDKQAVFVQYQDNPDRGGVIRDLIRMASTESDDVQAIDARRTLSASCLELYQAYGSMAASEVEGKSWSKYAQLANYSLYELAEQCNPVGRSDSFENVRTLAFVYRGMLDAAVNSPGVHGVGMQFAIKADIARSVKFLEAAGMKSKFMDMNDGLYGQFLQAAVDDMPVYANSDARKFFGRSRPKGAHDIADTMSTDALLAENSKRLEAFQSIIQSQESVRVRDTSDLDRAISGLTDTAVQLGYDDYSNLN